MPTISHLLEALTGHAQPLLDFELFNTVIDSRKASAGDLFVALKGEQVDGHDYVQHAFDKGAICALVSRDMPTGMKVLDIREKTPLQSDHIPAFPICLRVENTLEALQQFAAFWRSKFDLRVIGITGSVGKTTTKDLIANVLANRYKTLKSSGNQNNEIGLPLTLLNITNEHTHAVLEMGFYVAGEIKLLCDIAKPQVGVLTMIGMVHAERAGSLDAIASGKAELVENLPPAPLGTAILNYDDPYVLAMKDKTTANVFTYGLSPEADLWASEIESMGLNGIRFKLHYQGDSFYVRAPLIGRHSVHTVLRSAAVGLTEGLNWQEILTGLQDPKTQVRLVPVTTPSKAMILDDTYNSSPESAIAALNLLEDLDGRKIAILGDMLELGMYEEAGHRMVGSRAAEVCDELYTIGPRAHTIAKAAFNAGLQAENITEFETTEEAINHLQDQFAEGDIVLIKGSHSLNLSRLVSVMEFAQ